MEESIGWYFLCRYGFCTGKATLDENGLLPDGTKVPSKVQITVSDKEPDKPVDSDTSVTLDVPDTPDAPASGDKAPVMPLVVLLAISAVAICVLLIPKVRKKNQE